MSIDALFGREEQDLHLLLTKKLSKLPVDDAYHSAFEICWSMMVGLVGDENYAEDFMDTFMGHSYTNRNPSPDYFAKLIRDSGIVTARVSSDINQFYLLAYPMTIGSVDSEIESYEICREGCLVPLLCLADEIAKKNPFPIFSVMDRKKSLL